MLRQRNFLYDYNVINNKQINRNILMRLKLLAIYSLLIGGAGLLPLGVVTAQNPPAQTYQPGFWQPVARVDVNRPITLNLINQTGLIVDYAITDVEMKAVSIQSAQTVILDDIKPPLYVVIYPNSKKNPINSRIYLKYEVEVTQTNIIEVKISQTEEDNQSHRSFNLQESGAIYIY